MKRFIFLLIYNLLLPVFLVISIPGYLIKMKKRGGFGTGLSERFGIYRKPASQEPQGGLYVHAVSVGETFIALKFIREWCKTHSEPVILATSTATGHQVARDAALPQVRPLYSPLDVPGLSGRCLDRFKPKAVVLIEAELWPNFAEACHSRKIPMVMVNARLSPRSEGRYAKVRGITRLLFERLTALAAQNENDKGRFARIGVNPDIITAPGSIKFDVMGDEPKEIREDFRSILDTLRGGKPVVLAASTHAGEEALIATAIREAGGFPLIVPRHAERRPQVTADLQQAGFTPLLRTAGEIPAEIPANVCYVADTTGELRDWTALADVVIIGKSFLAKGGQNPVEAIAARKPVITGPDMTNFADLVTLLKKEDGILACEAGELASTLRTALDGSPETQARTERAYNALHVHSGATRRSVELVETLYGRA
jgi:3-deoxy-D-manno-octulosonic-acid transferase